jgi:hypothetical protein
MAATRFMTDNQNDSLIDQLLQTHNEFRKLYKDHRTLEAKLGELDRRPFLTTEEEFERKRIQKLKLNRKDRMASILRTQATR